MNIDNLAQLFDFSNVSNIINMIMVAVLSFVTLKQRAEVIIAKFKRKEVEGKLEEKDTQIELLTETVTFLGDAMNVIIQSSKLGTQEKIHINSAWTKVKMNVEEGVVGKYYEKAAEVKTHVENVIDTGKDIVAITKNILGNAVEADVIK